MAKKGPPIIAMATITAGLHYCPTQYQLYNCVLPSRKATDVGAVGSEDYAKVGVGGRANNNLARGFKNIATKSVDFP